MGKEKPDRHGDIEIQYDPAFQRRYWLFQRIGWTLMVLGGFATALGLFGSRGILDDAVAEGGGVRLEYERFPHVETRMRLVLRAERAPQPEPRFALWIDRDYLAAVRVEDITPAPSAVLSGDTGLVFVFETAPPHDSLRVSLHAAPTRLGVLRGQLRAGSAGLRFTQFVYP